jgi:hypothetical protein
MTSINHAIALLDETDRVPTASFDGFPSLDAENSWRSSAERTSILTHGWHRDCGPDSMEQDPADQAIKVLTGVPTGGA